MQSEVIHNKWVNVIAVGFLDVTGAFINNRVWYNDATESVECAVLREIKTSECEAVRVFCVVRVMRKYADCIDQLSYLGTASVLLNRELATNSAVFITKTFDEQCSIAGRDIDLFCCVLSQR